MIRIRDSYLGELEFSRWKLDSFVDEPIKTMLIGVEWGRELREGQ